VELLAHNSKHLLWNVDIETQGKKRNRI